MSLFISSYSPTSSSNDDQEVNERRRREHELRQRKRADRQTMERYLQVRVQEASAQVQASMESPQVQASMESPQVQASMESPQGLLHALLHEERHKAWEEATQYTPALTPQQVPPTRPDRRPLPAMHGLRAGPEQRRSDTPPSHPMPQYRTDRERGRPAAPDRPSDPASRPMALAAMDDAGKDRQAAASQSLPSEALTTDTDRIALFTDKLDRMLQDMQSHAAEGRMSTDKLFGMLEDAQRYWRGIDAGGIDETSARRIDGACRFLAAFIDSLDCNEAERVALIRKLDESRQLIGTTQVPPFSGEDRCCSLGPDASLHTQSVTDRQTLYAYLELLKSLANAPGNDVEARQLAARVAAMQTSNPAAALKRLAENGDPSISLYVDEIARHLQKVDVHRKNARVSRLRGSLAAWMEAERDNMVAAIQHAETINGYASTSRFLEEARELERRADTMPLLILQRT